ncbi:Antigen WC1.1, partial [Galemys pyrenaicus]
SLTSSLSTKGFFLSPLKTDSPSPAGLSLQSPGEAAIPGMGERGRPLVLRQDPGYDDGHRKEFLPLHLTSSQPGGPWFLPKVSRGHGVEGLPTAQLSAHHVGLRQVPAVITDGAPGALVKDLHMPSQRWPPSTRRSCALSAEGEKPGAAPAQDICLPQQALQPQRRALPATLRDSQDQESFLLPDSLQLRLVDGYHSCAGRVEIFAQDSSVTICDHGWDLHDAHVVCRQLGCGEALNATVSAHFGGRSEASWDAGFQCTGGESLLWQCPLTSVENNYCSPGKEAGVICSGMASAFSKGLRNRKFQGSCVLLTLGSTVRALQETKLLSCVQVNYKACVSPCYLDWSRGPCLGTRPSPPVADPGLPLCFCRMEARELSICKPLHRYISPSQLPVPGSSPSRVLTGPWPCRQREAAPAGRKQHVLGPRGGLGCGSALDTPGAATFGPGNGPIWLDEVRCRGGESSLWACAAEPWGQSDCKHEEDAGVRCSASLPGFSGCSGPWPWRLLPDPLGTGGQEGARVVRRQLSPPPSEGSVMSRHGRAGGGPPGPTTLPSPHDPLLSSGSGSGSARGPGIFSLPGVLCFVLGALLFLVLVILGVQLHRGRAEHR